jgi:hypothetical protein
LLALDAGGQDSEEESSDSLGNGDGGEGRNRTEEGSFSETHYSANTTPPPEANSLITNERQ